MKGNSKSLNLHKDTQIQNNLSSGLSKDITLLTINTNASSWTTQTAYEFIWRLALLISEKKILSMEPHKGSVVYGVCLFCDGCRENTEVCCGDLQKRLSSDNWREARGEGLVTLTTTSGGPVCWNAQTDLSFRSH